MKIICWKCGVSPHCAGRGKPRKAHTCPTNNRLLFHPSSLREDGWATIITRVTGMAQVRSSFFSAEFECLVEIRGVVMTENIHTRRGFTVLELLVTVLIIGILAAIALPQYKRSVEKARAATIFPLLKAIGEAQEDYFLANGTYAKSFSNLSVEIPFTGTEKWATSYSFFKDVRSNHDWSIQLDDVAVYAGRLTGPYAGSGFAYFYKDWVCPQINGLGVCAQTLTCMVKTDAAGGVGGGGTIYKEYCAKIFGATKSVQSGTIGLYKAMP